MAPTKTKLQSDRHCVGTYVTMDELAVVDYVARLLNGATPKRSEAMRHLMMLGWSEFQRLNAHRGLSVPPSLAAAAPSLEVPIRDSSGSLPRESESEQGENDA